MWNVERIIQYKKLMFFRNIEGNESRLSGRMIIEMEKADENYRLRELEGIAAGYELDIWRIRRMRKSEWKSEVKRKMHMSMVEEFESKK